MSHRQRVMALLLSRLCRTRRHQLPPRLCISNLLVSGRLLQTLSHRLRAMDSSYDNNGHDFFRYTSGWWLWNEEEQLRERYRRFNVAKLQSAAASTVGARSCAEMSKIGEGNFNKVFKLTMDDNFVVIARISHPNAGPPTITTASEVATMDFVRK